MVSLAVSISDAVSDRPPFERFVPETKKRRGGRSDDPPCPLRQALAVRRDKSPEAEYKMRCRELQLCFGNSRCLKIEVVESPRFRLRPDRAGLHHLTRGGHRHLGLVGQHAWTGMVTTAVRRTFRTSFRCCAKALC